MDRTGKAPFPPFIQRKSRTRDQNRREAPLSKTLSQLLCDLEEEEVMAQVRERLARGDDPIGIIEECRRGMEVVGKRFEDKEYFITELIMAGGDFCVGLGRGGAG